MAASLSLWIVGAAAPPATLGARIAPSLRWATYIHDYHVSRAVAIGIDRAGNMLTLVQIGDNSDTGGSTLLKLNPSRNEVMWRVHLPAVLTVMAIDANGNAYVAGTASSLPYPTLHPIHGFGSGAFVVSKINPAGQLVYSTYLGPQHISGLITDMAVNRRGEALVAGSSDGPFPQFAALSPGIPLQGTSPTQFGFAVKLARSGDRVLYSTSLGDHVVPRGAGTDGAGYDYVAIDLWQIRHSYPVNHALSGPASAGATSVVLKLRQGAKRVQLVWSTGVSTDYVSAGFAVNGAGATYVAFGSRLVKINSTGTGYLYRRAFPGVSGLLHGVALDAAGNAYVRGDIDPQADLSVPPVAGTRMKGTSATYLAEVGPGGRVRIALSLPGTSSTPSLSVHSVAVDGRGHLALAGQGTPPSFPMVHDLHPRVPIPQCWYGTHDGVGLWTTCPTAVVAKIDLGGN